MNKIELEKEILLFSKKAQFLHYLIIISLSLIIAIVIGFNLPITSPFIVGKILAFTFFFFMFFHFVGLQFITFTLIYAFGLRPTKNDKEKYYSKQMSFLKDDIGYNVNKINDLLEDIEKNLRNLKKMNTESFTETNGNTTVVKNLATEETLDIVGFTDEAIEKIKKLKEEMKE